MVRITAHALFLAREVEVGQHAAAGMDGRWFAPCVTKKQKNGLGPRLGFGGTLCTVL